MIALEYDGEHHRTDPMQYRKDIRRMEAIQRQGWIVIRVIAGDRADDILERLGSAWLSRGDAYVPPSRRSA
jgi:very-short-patch-repair endonuclease